MASSEGLSLYQYRGCPFCTRVMEAADRLGVELELRDTLADPDHARAVIEATGRRRVPVLRIDEPQGETRWLPDSAAIVAFLEARFGP
jgi:glutaredoxin